MGLPRWFSDPLNGGIETQGLCKELIDTAPFQRLRLIKQLSLMHYVFPGAEHSRFLHSLGVYANMQKMCAQLNIALKDVPMLLAAALLHDIGHYPLSHLGEWAYQTAEYVSTSEMFESQLETSEYNAPLLLGHARRPRPDKKLHEKLGAKIVTSHPEIVNILEKHKVDPAMVAQLIMGQAQNYGEWHLYQQMIHSNLDADRLDYLIRDSQHTGAVYGKIDRDYLIRCMVAGSEEIQSVGKDRSTIQVLGVSPKGLHALEHYILARYFHYSQIVYHKTVGAFEVVAKALFGLMVQHGIGFPRTDAEVEAQICDNEFLKRFNDQLFFRQLTEAREELIEVRDSVGPLVDCIRFRQRPRILIDIAHLRHRSTAQRESIVLLENFMKNESEQLAGWLGVHPDHVGYHAASAALERSSTVPVKYLSDPRVEEGRREALRVISLNDQIDFAVENDSSLLSILNDYTYDVFRIFYVEPRDGSLDERDKRHEEATEKLMSRCAIS